MLTIVYVRVSTDDQVEHSPEAQRRRCVEHAQTANLGAPRVLSDEGWSAKNLDRPAMSELIALVEADQVAHVIVWRLDRLSRDAGDLNRLIRLLDEHCVTLHSLNEGLVEVGTASGRMQAGMHGVFAQYYREHNIENIKLGQREAVRKGLWINRAPTGYDLDDRVLVANDDAHLVRRAFALRAAGKSYPPISAACGLPYSTVRSIIHNQVYLGLTRLGDQWFPGAHQALISQAEFDAAHRGHVPGRRRGTDLLSGRVRCGTCGRVVSIDTNGRNQPIYRCRHRGKGCHGMPGRSARGLHRAARLGIDLLRTDDELLEAIRAHLVGTPRAAGGGTAQPGHAGALASLRRKRDRLLQLFLDEQITGEYFAEQERAITAKINALDTDHREAVDTERRTNALAEAFEQAAALLRDPSFDLDQVWENANDAERRVLVEELIESVVIHADRLEVTVTGAPPLLVELDEVGLKPGTGTVGSVDRPARSRTGHWRLSARG